MMQSLQDFQNDFYIMAYGSKDEQNSILVNNPLFSALPLSQIQQYQWMVYANHADTLETIYPYCFKLLRSDWKSLVQSYLRRFPPKSYLLYEAALDFPQFVAEQVQADEYPFLEDLASYELLEASILRWPDYTEAQVKRADFLPLDKKIPVLNPAAKAYDSWYPIHTIVDHLKGSIPDQEVLKTIPVSPISLWVYRHENYQCRFFQVTPFIQAFLQACKDNREQASYQELVITVCKDLNILIADHFWDEFTGLLKTLEDLTILIGSK